VVGSPKPLTLDEEGEAFVLRHQGADGKETELILTEQDVLNLGNSAAGFAKAILLRRMPGSGGVNTVLATKVARFSADPDSLGEDILLALVTPNGGQMIYAISPSIGRLLRERLDKSIVEIESGGLTRQ
jgi:hypothetical protein